MLVKKTRLIELVLYFILKAVTKCRAIVVICKEYKCVLLRREHLQV